MSRSFNQILVADLVARCFGGAQLMSKPQRGIRLVEEAIEAAQAAGCKREMVHKLVDYVFDRPKGSVMQELGGVIVTAYALAEADRLDLEECFQFELRRVFEKPVEHFAVRNKTKDEAGFKA